MRPLLGHFHPGPVILAFFKSAAFFTFVFSSLFFFSFFFLFSFAFIRRFFICFRSTCPVSFCSFFFCFFFFLSYIFWSVVPSSPPYPSIVFTLNLLLFHHFGTVLASSWIRFQRILPSTVHSPNAGLSCSLSLLPQRFCMYTFFLFPLFFNENLDLSWPFFCDFTSFFLSTFAGLALRFSPAVRSSIFVICKLCRPFRLFNFEPPTTF